jgi:hypothetical protein
MQVGVVALVLVQGGQTAAHWYFASAAPSTVPQARYDYDPYGRVAANMQPAFQYANSSFYAHASSAVSLMSVHAYDPTPGRWVERDPLPGK